MRKAIIVSCFIGWYQSRLKYIENVFVQRGYDVQIWMSDFSNITKEKIEPLESFGYVHVLRYKSNFSLKRIISHIGFGFRIYSILKRERPDAIYALIPPNIVAKFCARYKRKYPSVHLFFDVIDMWPESFTGRMTLELPFQIWTNVRDNSLYYADYIFTECSLYQSFLKSDLTPSVSSLYMCREKPDFLPAPVWDGKKLIIAYLGSINNVINIPLISELVYELKLFFDVRFRIVGGGENSDVFLDTLRNAGAVVDYFGAIFDKSKIREIFTGCHFAVNMMKSGVCVGLTIKSVDYFQMGIPLLNTIKGDTEILVNRFHCGINVDDSKKIASELKGMSCTEYNSMREATQKVFLENFVPEVLENKVSLVFQKLMCNDD